MTSGRQFGLILVSVIGLASLVSHAVSKFAGIDTRLGHNLKLDQNFHGPPIVEAGSSMVGCALDESLVAADLGRPIELVSTASGSPCELEQLTLSAPDTDLTIVSASIYDLDEYVIADFRAQAVPIRQTAHDLWESHSDWLFVKRTMSRYPLCYLQWLFPSAGRALGIMAGARARLASLRGHGETEALPTVEARVGGAITRVSEWPPSRLLRNLAQQRALCFNSHAFDGPKHLAMGRFLRRLETHGTAVVVVLPVSPPYVNDLLTPGDQQACEKSLDEIARQAPQTKWVRLDQIPELQHSELFADLLHLNQDGRRIATAAFRERLKSLLHAP